MEPAIIVAILAAVAVILLFFGLFGGRRSPRRAHRAGRAARRSQARNSPEASRANRRGLRSSLFGSRSASGVDRVVERRDWGANMARGAGARRPALRPSEYLAIRAGAVVGALGVTFLLGATILPGLDNALAWLVAAIARLVGAAVLGQPPQDRAACKAFNDHLADTITLIANALRAGASFLQAIELVVRETQPPISTEFNRVIREVNLGLPFEQALNNMVRRVRSDDLELMTTAITIQHQVGGNLAEILDSIAFTIRERVRIIGEIRVLTAQQRMSGYVVAGLPIGLVVILSVIAPKFMEPMF